VLTPLAPKHTNFEAKSSFFKSPCVIKEFMISKVMQLTLDPKNNSYTFNNNGMQH